MTPSLPDRDVVRNKLRVIEESLDVLETVGPVTGDRLWRVPESPADVGSTTSATR